MSKLWRAAMISAVATGAVAVAWTLFSRWTEETVQAGEGVAGMPKKRSREDVIDELTDQQKQALLDELGQHV